MQTLAAKIEAREQARARWAREIMSARGGRACDTGSAEDVAQAVDGEAASPPNCPEPSTEAP